MQKWNLVYDGKINTQHSAREKTCLIVLARKAKTEIVCSFQVLSEKSRGVWLTLEIGKNDRGLRKCRSMGVFYNKFIKYLDEKKGRKSNDPEESGIEANSIVNPNNRSRRKETIL